MIFVVSCLPGVALQILPKMAAERFVSDMKSRTLAVADLWALMLIWRIFKYKMAPFTHYVAEKKREKVVLDTNIVFVWVESSEVSSKEKPPHQSIKA